MRKFNRIFGIGLNRAGTSSLHKAFGIINIPSFHDSTRLYEQFEMNKMMGLPLIKGLEQYRAFSDHPCDWEFKRLDRENPDSLFIYTQRELKPWIESKKFLHSHNGTTVDEEILSKQHKEHFDKVKDHFKDREDELLVIRICEGGGWKELCEFLEIDIPDKDFPHIGARK